VPEAFDLIGQVASKIRRMPVQEKNDAHLAFKN
jgi:hypothetical protein